MKKVHIRNYILLIFASILLLACSLEKREGESAVKQPVELVIRASQGGSTRAMENVDDVIEVGAELAPSTRTELGNGPGVNTNGDVNAGAEQQIRWVNDDQIMVWAEPAVSPQGYAFEQKVFSLAYYNHDYHSADFSAMVASTLDRDYDYTYYAIYPSPKYRNSQGQESAVSGITHNGTEVTYTLSATQSGEYNPAYDIMWGKVTGAALIERDDSGSVDVWRQPELHMRHLLHMMRIRVPENRNLLGRDVKRLEITFPQAVVGGTAKVNVKTGEVVWSGQSNKVTINLPDENLLNANGRYVWVQIKPGMINGDISFQMYDDYGVPTQVLSASVNKAFAGGHITPVNLTIPRSKYNDLTYIEIDEIANNLGEAWNTMTLSGYTFVKPFTLETTNSNVVTPNDAKKYKVAIVAAASSLQNGAIAASYDSPNAIVSNSIKLPQTISNNLAEVDSQVPYLFFEDFSGILAEGESYGDNNYEGGDERKQPGKSLNGVMPTNGWNAARYWVKKGSGSFRFNLRFQNVSIGANIPFVGWVGTDFRTKHYGRLDTPPLTSLKSNANVKLVVKFDAGAYVQANSGGSSAKNSPYTQVALATHTNGSNPIDGVGIGTAENGSIENFGTTHYTSDVMANSYGDNAFQDTYPTHTANVSSATRSTRLCFYPSTTYAEQGLSVNAEFNVYLDNIRVSIAN